MFPHIYDTKVLSNAAEYFGRTDLGKVYEKCTSDAKLKDMPKVAFDLKNGFVNYDGAGLLSHYHEAAYDAYMTGVAFAGIMKYKEVEHPKDEQKGARGGNNQRGGRGGNRGRGADRGGK